MWISRTLKKMIEIHWLKSKIGTSYFTEIFTTKTIWLENSSSVILTLMRFSKRANRFFNHFKVHEHNLFFREFERKKKSFITKPIYRFFTREKMHVFHPTFNSNSCEKKLKNYAESFEGKSKLVIRKLGSKVPITFNYRGDFQMWLIENIDNILGCYQLPQRGQLLSKSFWNFFSWNWIFSNFKLFPSSKIDIWPYLKWKKKLVWTFSYFLADWKFQCRK